MNNFHLLQKYIQTPQQFSCDFCKSVDHDERQCCNYELMMERTPTYRMQVETQPLEQGARGMRGG